MLRNLKAQCIFLVVKFYFEFFYLFFVIFTLYRVTAIFGQCDSSCEIFFSFVFTVFSVSVPSPFS